MKGIECDKCMHAYRLIVSGQNVMVFFGGFFVFFCTQHSSFQMPYLVLCRFKDGL